MKPLLLFLALAVGLVALPFNSIAKDRKYDDDGHKVTKDLRNELNALQSHYDQVKDRVKSMSGDRRTWQGMQQIHSNIDGIAGQLDSGNFDPRDIHGRIQQSNEDLRRLQDNAERDSKRHGGFYRQY